MAGFSSTQKNAVLSILLICLMAAGFDGVSAIYSMEETCAYIQEGHIGDPTNCQNWGYCKGGKLLGNGTCNAGLLFDTKLSECNFAKDVQCLTTAQNACNTATEPSYISDPNNCNRYCYCENKAMVCFNCPDDQVYDPKINQCVYTKSYSCPTNSICRLVKNNVFAGDPQNCGNYIRCIDGAGVSESCKDANERFDPMLGACVANYDCSTATGPGSQDSQDVPTENTQICSSWSDSGNQTVQYFADSRTCYGYFSCTSKTGVGIWGSCPYATHFNPQEQKCVTPYAYKCPYDRCGNLNLQFVAQVGCSGYSVCKNQVTTSNSTCSDTNDKGYNWYDEYGGACVAAKPTQAICN